MDPAEVLARVETLNDDDIRVLSLYSLGWEHKSIALHLSRGERNFTENEIKHIMRRVRDKLGVDGVSLGLFYVDHVLPHDILPGYAPGEKLELWRAQAELRRQELRDSPQIKPSEIKLATLLANPQYAALTDTELGALLAVELGRDKPLTGASVQFYLRKIGFVLPGRTTKTRVGVIGRLAPFDAE